jgi:outer membrane protein assembly factor BamD
MPATFFRRSLPSLVLLVLAACHRGGFQPAKFKSNDALFRASLRELQLRHWGNAANGFERLTTDLPARDRLLPQAFYYLGKAHQGKHEYILAAQAFSRVPESFPEDTLADDATFEAGVSYAKLWRKPSLDAEYGETALSTLRSFLAAYPDSPLRPRAEREIQRLNEWFAIKNYQNGMLYFRRKAYDSAIIYFKDVVKLYPQTAQARAALLRLARAYRAIKYKEDVAETCATLHTKYPGDREVREVCGAAPAPVPTSARTTP